ncbi:hypothetical protein B0H16DRAFT_679496 [Mycena metata]|uniref:HD domain-containing protein n=1 Tax=Mycena metata TaxID=1033252 RepID=A0AAD7J915_9AGAR|nr:hypothetical protein B0H16DRAFT_679496 [Mycena metata]
MSFPQLFDAYVPSNGPDLLAAANFAPTYVPFKTLQAVAIDPAAQATTFAYAKRLSTPAVFAHVVRCFYFALALLYTGFPSGTPGVAQIGFEELSMRLYHTTLLHDLGWSNATEVVDHPAHAMTFELHGAIIVYEHLHAVSPNLNATQVGDIVETIVLHSLQWSSGNSSATQIITMLTAYFDVGGFNGTGLAGVNFTQLFHPKTVAEIEEAYPRGNLYNDAIAVFVKEFGQKPNCLLSHVGGLEALEKDVRVGPIVAGNLSNAENVRALQDLDALE